MESKTLVPEIFTSIAKQKLSEGAILVDVRESNEVEEVAYDVPGLIHIPLSELDKNFTELPQDKTLIVACKSGGRSLRAANFLINHGYENVYNLRGGIIGWISKGNPVIGELSDDNSCDCSDPNCC